MALHELPSEWLDHRWAKKLTQTCGYNSVKTNYSHEFGVQFLGQPLESNPSPDNRVCKLFNAISVTCPLLTASMRKRHRHTHTHTHTQPFNGLWSRTTRLGRYQKKHSPTHTHPDHRTSFLSQTMNLIN